MFHFLTFLRFVLLCLIFFYPTSLPNWQKSYESRLCAFHMFFFVSPQMQTRKVVASNRVHQHQQQQQHHWIPFIFILLEMWVSFSVKRALTCNSCTSCHAMRSMACHVMWSIVVVVVDLSAWSIRENKESVEWKKNNKHLRFKICIYVLFVCLPSCMPSLQLISVLRPTEVVAVKCKTKNRIRICRITGCSGMQWALCCTSCYKFLKSEIQFFFLLQNWLFTC